VLHAVDELLERVWKGLCIGIDLRRAEQTRQLAQELGPLKPVDMRMDAPSSKPRRSLA
jgi:hypothetical protein